ncbi:MAG: tRNA (guanosine(37)-N1)-methyltransferase TrmD, partial [Clostridia bacterium]|nr:tRNA (guanosine(37)-N1)-methyltransferase TrmD [Clostridia bacterium]
MKFNVLTLFPDMLRSVLGESIIGRAEEKGIIELNIVNIRDFSKDKHKKTDDTPFSGGGGMLMTPQPIYDAYMSIADGRKEKPHTVYMSPKGKVFNQEKAKELSKMDEIVLLCGHYEGVDQRVIDMIVDEEISIGDYVLTGGELPALVLTDAIARMQPGVLSADEAFEK